MGKMVAAWFIVAGVLASTAPGPREVVETAVTRARAALQAPDVGQPVARRAARRDPARERAEVRRVVSDLFDVEEMARRALSRHWAARSREEQAEFVALFADLLERTYAARVEAYSGEHVVYQEQIVDGSSATVRSRVVLGGGAEIPVQYRLHRRDGRWRVYDVLIDHVSFIATYRRQFDGIIRRESYAALADRLRRREIAMTAPDSAR
jgi:phospholipid transport system substrate-binding protein